MRIGVLVDPAPPQAGGSHTFERAMLRALEEHGAGQGFHFVVLGRWSARNTPVSPCAHMEYVGILSDPLLGAKAKWWKIRDAMKRMARPLPHFKATVLAERFARAKSVNLIWHVSPNYGATDMPFVYTVWDLQHRLQPWFPEVSDTGQWGERERQYANVIPRAAALITGTEEGKREIARFYLTPPERIHVVPFPTPETTQVSEEFSRSVLEKYGISGKYVFYPAQFWPHKNHITLIKAAHLLREKQALRVSLVLVGFDTSVRRYLEGAIRFLKMDDQVHILGFVPRDERDALYSRALALGMPTFFGPDNLPPLEAFALGCPVIASNVPGAEEQLGDAALLVDPRSEEGLAAAIRRLHDDEALRRDLIEKGRARAARWTGRDYVLSMLSIFDQLRPYLRSWMAAADPVFSAAQKARPK